MRLMDFIENSRPSSMLSNCNAFFTMAPTKKAHRQIKDLYFSMFLVPPKEQSLWALLDLGYYFRAKDGLMMSMGILCKKNSFDFNDILLSIGRLHNNQDADNKSEKARPPRWEGWFCQMAQEAGRPLDQLSIDDMEKIFFWPICQKHRSKKVCPPKALPSHPTPSPKNLPNFNFFACFLRESA